MHWHFGLKIKRVQFTVSAFSVTVWQTLLHIVIIVNWNKSGLIQTDVTNDVVVNSLMAWLITESITMFSVHLPFQCSKVNRLYQHVTTIWPKKIRIILLIFDFKIGNGRQLKRLYLITWGEFFFFFTYFFLITTRIRDFLLDIDSAYKSFVWTATIWLEISGCYNIVSILLLYLYYNLLISGNFDDHRTLVRLAYILLLYI
jgi:hypothetical protein